MKEINILKVESLPTEIAGIELRVVYRIDSLSKNFIIQIPREDANALGYEIWNNTENYYNSLIDMLLPRIEKVLKNNSELISDKIEYCNLENIYLWTK